MSDESNKALHQMCKYLCEGLPHIDDFEREMTAERGAK
jgi:hypothetical protein